MSQEINNREYRQTVIRELITELHNGKSVDEVKARFKAAFDGVSATEISDAEQALIQGGLPVEEVQRLCDVHAAVFRDSLLPEETPQDATQTPGHPVHTLIEENRALEALIDRDIKPALTDGDLPKLHTALNKLNQVNIHYLRKENLLFPYMERHGITAPPKVMWGVDDEIRTLLKQAITLANEPSPDLTAVRSAVTETLTKLTEMIFKEENIMLPMLLDAFTQNEWKSIADESAELGYCLINTPPIWSPPSTQSDGTGHDLLAQTGSIVLPTGVLSIAELTHMLDALPIDISFVDKDDRVKYFSQGAERIFPRTKAVIGRNVANCHPPASVHIVEGILSDFKNGKKDHEDFWIPLGGKFVYIRYFAVRDEQGAYLGTLEVTQNIKPIQALTGEKRLVEH